MTPLSHQEYNSDQTRESARDLVRGLKIHLRDNEIENPLQRLSGRCSAGFFQLFLFMSMVFIILEYFNWEILYHYYYYWEQTAMKEIALMASHKRLPDSFFRVKDNASSSSTFSLSADLALFFRLLASPIYFFLQYNPHSLAILHCHY